MGFTKESLLVFGINILQRFKLKVVSYDINIKPILLPIRAQSQPLFLVLL